MAAVLVLVWALIGTGDRHLRFGICASACVSDQQVGERAGQVVEKV